VRRSFQRFCFSAAALTSRDWRCATTLASTSENSRIVRSFCAFVAGQTFSVTLRPFAAGKATTVSLPAAVSIGPDATGLPGSLPSWT